MESDGLEVMWWLRETLRGREQFVRRNDSEIEQAIRKTCLCDLMSGAHFPEITVNDGVVTLRGIVDDGYVRRVFEVTARNTPGVLRVMNHLAVAFEGKAQDMSFAVEALDGCVDKH